MKYVYIQICIPLVTVCVSEWRMDLHSREIFRSFIIRSFGILRNKLLFFFAVLPKIIRVE